MFSRIGALALMIVLLLSAAAVADETSLEPQDGVLVLRNGHLLRGRITCLGDRFLITLGPSDEIRVPAGQVEFQCRDADDAYRRKFDAIDPRNVPQRLALAEWCLRNDLPHRTADQLLAAVMIEPHNPQVKYFEQRLQLVAQPPPDAAPAPDGQTRFVSLDELERILGELPAGTVELFTSAVQPVLLNRCSTSACHGQSSASTFRLLRPAAGSTPPRRYTQRNLYATLQTIDRHAPDSSPLLTAPLGPHGGLVAAVFGPHEMHQHEMLARWVRLATSSHADPQPETIAAPSENLLRTTDTRALPWTDSPAPADTSESAPSPAVRASEQPGTAAHENVPSASRSASDRRATVKPFTPRDPFDPEIFNRRFFATRAEAGESQQAKDEGRGTKDDERTTNP